MEKSSVKSSLSLNNGIVSVMWSGGLSCIIAAKLTVMNNGIREGFEFEVSSGFSFDQFNIISK